MMAPSNIDRLQVSQNQGVRLISAKMMRHELQMLPVEHRVVLGRAKLYRKIRGNTKHPLHTTINSRQRNGWTTVIPECHRLVSRQLQPDDNTYYTGGSSDGTRVAAEVVHKEEEIIIRLNDSASVLDAEMTALRVALVNASEPRDMITIHTDSLTAVNILINRKLDLNTITRAIRDAASILTEAHY